MKSKLALGTVQFGLNYGINNKTGIPSDKELEEIISTATDSGIDTFDTAIAYGNAEERVGKLLPAYANIISKFPYRTTLSEFSNILKESLQRLSKSQLYAFLAHDANSLIVMPELWYKLKELQKEHLIQKKGFSLYYPEQLEQLLDKGMLPDIIQIPYSLLDRRFESYLPVLKKQNIEIHARSVFLQGLYLIPVKNLPKKLKPLSHELELINKLAVRFNTNIQSLALNFVYQNNQIDKVVIGIDSKGQLLENVLSIQNWLPENDLIFNEIRQIECRSSELLIPSHWR